VDFAVIFRSSILFIFASLCWGLVSSAVASTHLLNSEAVGLNFTQEIRSDLYVLMSQEAKHASDVEMVMQKSRPLRTISPVDPTKDWRDVDWKDPFAPKVAGRAEVDMQITLEQDIVPPPSSTDSYEELLDPFAPKNEAPELSDPFEGYNRFMFGFNEGFYEHLMEPIARGYRDVVNEDIRMAISNIFNNALAPVKLVSSFLQGDLDKTGRVIGRTIINTTLGLGGMFDVAGSFGIESVNEDLDQTLGSYGIPNGPYIVLPLFGPSTIRGIVGRAGGSFLSPTFHFAPSVEVGAGITVSDKINDASFILDDKKQLEDSTVDEYESMKDFYNQYRFGLVNE
ncbi:uncharacterized protein METZ01_LOCUS209159, partial [marine metagenome]